jgi:hypothetical protein
MTRDRILLGATNAAGAVGLLLGIGLLVSRSAYGPYGLAFSHPLTLVVGAIAGFSVAGLPRTWPVSMRVALALVGWQRLSSPLVPWFTS